jgi:hypothetical protein
VFLFLYVTSIDGIITPDEPVKMSTSGTNAVGTTPSKASSSSSSPSESAPSSSSTSGTTTSVSTQENGISIASSSKEAAAEGETIRTIQQTTTTATEGTGDHNPPQHNAMMVKKSPFVFLG